MAQINRQYEERFLEMTGTLKIVELPLTFGYHDWVEYDDRVRTCAIDLIKEIEDNYLMLDNTGRSIYLDSLRRKIRPHQNYDKIQLGLGWELQVYPNLPDMLKERSEFRNPIAGNEDLYADNVEEFEKARSIVASTSVVGALLILNNYRRLAWNFINDELEIEALSFEFEKIEYLSDKYLIFQEFGIIEDITGRVGHSPKIVAAIISTLLNLNKESAKQIAKIHSQYGTGHSNDPIKSADAYKRLENFLKEWKMEPKRVVKS